MTVKNISVKMRMIVARKRVHKKSFKLQDSPNKILRKIKNKKLKMKKRIKIVKVTAKIIIKKYYMNLKNHLTIKFERKKITQTIK